MWFLQLMSKHHKLQSFFDVPSISSPKQAAVVFTPALLFPPIFYPLPRGLIFLDPIPPLPFVYKASLPLNKQISIDYFLDWEGLHWDFGSTITSPVSAPYRIHFEAEATNALNVLFALHGMPSLPNFLAWVLYDPNIMHMFTLLNYQNFSNSSFLSFVLYNNNCAV